jgi:hypothetical protein
MIPSGAGADGKSPSVSWEAYQNRLPSEEELRGWIRMRKPPLWGLVTGQISQVVIVDLDPGADAAIMGNLEPHVKTPRGGGHYWFQHPGHHVKTCSGILPKIDIRGDGGFANCVGTNPKTNGKYTMDIMPTRDKLYPWDRMPRQIIRAMKKEKKTREAKPGEPIPEGMRDSTLASLAGSMRKRGMTEDEILAALVTVNKERCQPPLEDEQVAKIAKSVSRYEPQEQAVPKTPEGISARELMEMELPPLQYAIPEMIPEGLTLLAGKPKSGKSWLALEAAYSVTIGKNLLVARNEMPITKKKISLGRPEIERGGALVLGLEDGQRRLRSRLLKINSSDTYLNLVKASDGGIRITGKLGDIDIPDGLMLFTEWPRIGSGGIEELDKYLDQHPDTRLVVIDTIKRFTKRKGRGSAYDEDYDSVQPLQELATKRRVAILGVCHTRKAFSEEALDMVSGTFGLTGAVDNILVLRMEGGDEFRLSIISRDMQNQELAMMFAANCMWTALGDADTYFISEEREAILECIATEALPPTQIAKTIGKNPSTVKSLLSKMLRDGTAKKDSKGRYSAG